MIPNTYEVYDEETGRYYEITADELAKELMCLTDD